MAARHTAALLAIAAFAFAPALTAQGFEGVVRQRTIEVSLDALADRGFETSDALLDLPIEQLIERMQSSGELNVVEEEILISGSLIRMDASDEEMSGWVTIDLEAGVVRMVNPDEGMYMEMTASDMELMAASAGGIDEEAPEIIDRAETRTINGMRATAFDVSTFDETTRIWVSRDDAELSESFVALAEYATGLGMGDAPDPSMVVAEHGVPMLTQTIDGDAYRISEVVSVERRSVGSDLFQPPAGLRRVTVQDMMGGAMPPGGGATRPSSPGDALSALGRGTGAGSGGGREASALGALSGLLGGDRSSTVWIEYEVTGALRASGREEDVVMCSETPSGFQSRSLGDVVIGIEADGGGEGSHTAELQVAGEGERFEGGGRIVIETVGRDPLGLSIYEVVFEGSDLRSRDGEVANVHGSLSCAAM